MKMIVDYELCEGHGECVVAAPEIFEMDDAGEKVVLLQENPDESLREQAVEAVKICPIAALQLEG
ncbi:MULTISPECIES: ferredoxin [Prauserella salsuginis group]|uniref:Ferredoxin n=1 Tax=Prauserella salsuginis TaxID=387889 RepID=A0ABW6G0N9_9PSEU|nr:MULTISPECIES: ferredoxin [Prauserella salsuginis group]MCR3721920.1 Ferredoxin [Prauserella flava]MCR3735925.1 Ferredoxin [Prauserella salsuginis]